MEFELDKQGWWADPIAVQKYLFGGPTKYASEINPKDRKYYHISDDEVRLIGQRYIDGPVFTMDLFQKLMELIIVYPKLGKNYKFDHVALDVNMEGECACQSVAEAKVVYVYKVI